MKYKNSVAFIRTRKGNTVCCHMIATFGYINMNPRKFDYSGHICSNFEILENGDGQIIIHTYSKMKASKVVVNGTITISNVTEIEVLSSHDN